LGGKEVEGTIFSNKWPAINEEAVCRRTIYCINVAELRNIGK
jgi:hypothetical protein